MTFAQKFRVPVFKQFERYVSHARDTNTVNDYAMIKDNTKNSNMQISVAIINKTEIQDKYKTTT